MVSVFVVVALIIVIGFCVFVVFFRLKVLSILHCIFVVFGTTACSVTGSCAVQSAGK